MELWQLYLSQPPCTEPLWAVWDATVHLNSEEMTPGWEGNFEHSPKEKEPLGLWSSAQPFHFLIAQGEVGEWRPGPWLKKGKMGRSFFFPFLTHYRVRGRREYLNSLRKNVHRNVKGCPVESQLLQLLLSGSSFLKVNSGYGRTCYSLCRQTVNSRADLTWSQLSGNQGSLCLFLLLPVKRWTGKSTQDMLYFLFCKIMGLFVIAAFFRGNFKHIHTQTGYFKMWFVVVRK